MAISESFKIGLETGNLVSKFNETCDSPENAKKCENRCENDVNECIGTCGDESCNTDCQRELFICLSGKTPFFAQMALFCPPKFS